MADDTTIETPAASETPGVVTAEKKNRKPPQPRAAATTATDVPAKKTRAKRGSKQVAAKTEKVAVEPKKAVTRAPRVNVASPAPIASFEDGDGIADLIKLQEENAQLRKELSDKLRSENADLRRRLGKA